jgi:protoporphyrinogen oxidase
MNARFGVARRVLVVGAGPAGLTAALELVSCGFCPVVLEKSNAVGGIARTEHYKGFYFDMGGHRFFTKSNEIQHLWEELLGNDFIRRPRRSSIYYKQRYFIYPLKLLNVLQNLGLLESVLVVGSYIRWRLFPHWREDTFAQWTTNRFGDRLFRTFFKTYTEKVWGLSCSELSSEWGAQRIKNLSLASALLSTVIRPNRTIPTLIDHFHYPRWGPGAMWAAAKAQIESRGGVVRLGNDVVKVHRSGRRIVGMTVASRNETWLLEGTDVISSMPLTEFIAKLSPPPPEEVLRASGQLRYRDFLTVCLIVDRPSLFPDNWIYVHDPDVKIGRIQNFKNWSPEMVSDLSKTSLGLEYFCNEGDELWTMSDVDLIDLGKHELERLGLARPDEIEDGCVFRVPKAYPVYDSSSRQHLAVIRRFVDGLENFQTIGRNGLHRYNNQDHSMLTGIFAARNLALGESNDLWSVNADREYHEQGRRENLRASAPLAAGSTKEPISLVSDRRPDQVTIGAPGGH